MAKKISSRFSSDGITGTRGAQVMLARARARFTDSGDLEIQPLIRVSSLSKAKNVRMPSRARTEPSSDLRGPVVRKVIRDLTFLLFLISLLLFGLTLIRQESKRWNVYQEFLEV
jgi:hypothetical protein